MIKGVIFDCYGVLVHGSLDYLRSLASNENRQEFNDLAHASDRGFISRTDYLNGISRLIGRPPQEIQAIINQQEVRNPETLEYVLSLRSRYKTAMLSNVGRGAIGRLFSDKELEGLFEVVLLSSEVGLTKPGVEIYQLTASHLGLKPEECVMIDDISVNVEGARAAGMNGIRFEDIQQCRQELEVLLGESHA